MMIPAVGGKHCGGKRRRRGFSVRTRNRDAAAQPHEFGKHHRSRHHGNIGPARRLHFGIAFVYGRRNHQAVGPVNVFLAVSLINRGAQMLQTFRHGTLRQIRAADRITEIQKHFGNAAHTRAADAHEVNVLDYKLHFSFLRKALSGCFFDHVAHGVDGVGARQASGVVRELQNTVAL